jgi:hypothetical protein
MNEHNIKYSEISSFEDFHFEKVRLKFRRKIIETKLKLTYTEVSSMFSISNLFTSLAKEVVLPGISDFLGILISKVGNENNSGSDKDKEM